MDNQVKKLLDKINYERDNYEYFNLAKIDKIKVSKENNSWDIYLHNPTNFLPSVLFSLLECLKDYKDINCNISLTVDEINYELVNDYYIEILKSFNHNGLYVNIFGDRLVRLENYYQIEVGNKQEYTMLNKYLKDINKLFKKYGFDIEVNIFLNKEMGILIKNEIAHVKEDMPTIEVKEVKKESKETTKKIWTNKKTSNTKVEIKDINMEMNNVIVDAYVFGIEYFEPKDSDFKIITLKITDFKDSMYAKLRFNDNSKYEEQRKLFKEGKYYSFLGYIKNDIYAHDFVLYVNKAEEIEPFVKEIVDDYAGEKRIELHAHTFMSQMDGCVDPIKLVKTAYKWGHKAIAITDHNGCQAYPDLYHTVCDINKNLKEGEDKFKVIYGSELTLIDDSINIVVRPSSDDLLDTTYVVFDFETTGFNAGGGDSIIEIGAVKIKNGEIIDRYDELINPGHKLNAKITELTNITDEMLEDKDNEENAIKRFIEWVKDLPMVAHNAKFDTSFLEMCYEKYNLGTFNNTVIDTLELSRVLDSSYARHNLSALVKRYEIPWDEEGHHRADYDAEGTALVLHKMLQKLVNQNYKTIDSLNNLISKDEIHKYGRSYHVNILVKNKVGLKNLFKLISLANTKYLYKTPRILRSEITSHREGLLIGSGCYESEVFIEARSKSDEELTNIINFYDYVEVQPVDCYNHLIESSDFSNRDEVIENIKKIIRVTKDSGKYIVATGDVHHLRREDKITREIIVNQKVPGGGRHPLARNGITNIPSMHFRTTEEMLDDFSFLGEEEAKELVITNPNKINELIEQVEVIIETGGVPFSPRIDKSQETVTELVYTRAKEWYGEDLPHNIEERIAKELYGDIVFTVIKHNLEKENNYSDELAFKELNKTITSGYKKVEELVKNYIIETEEEKLSDEDLKKKVKKSLGGIIGGGFDVIYLIAQKLVKHSNDDGYLVGSRGSVGSSFVATMMGITEVNPLPAHYRCLKCKTSIFDGEDGVPLGKNYSTGFDLPDKVCPKCGEKMYKDGQDMPFATFLGFNADKVPDIDLNFSDLNQASAHEYTKVLFGEDNVYRAGTIGTVAEKTAYGFVKGYCEDKGITKRPAEIERLAIGCTGIKRTTGQHPGGIVVIPDYMDVFDFTPFQYPADDPDKAWRTTHFDYHAIDQDVLKLDILGHSDPTQLRMLQDLSGLDVTKVPLDDKETMSIFLSPKALGVTKDKILCDTGTLGVPEFGTPFTIGMLVDTKPTTFGELIKISGLSHGTDVWLGNAKDLIKNKIVPFKEVIGCRDDIMVYLMYHGLEPIKAFKIMEFVRKGKASKDPDTWKTYVDVMKENKIPEWFITSCQKIKYMFPKAHAAAYVISAFRIAWFKVHMPNLYYATYFSSRITDYDIDSMIEGYDAIKNKMIEITKKDRTATNKELSVLETLKIALEATARNIKFLPIDLYKSEATTFVPEGENSMYPPFSSIDGLGDTVAKNIVTERDKKPFLSIEDLQKRAKISSTLIDKMRLMGILKDLPESSQLTLF